MKILALETSCDETACAIIDENKNILGTKLSSQIDIHKCFGGVIPEVASRMHVEKISEIIAECLNEANLKMDEIDYIAYTMGPGLIGSLHIGAIAAKALAFYYNKPLLGIHHLKGHIFINELVDEFEYPLLALIVSGGHSELVYMENDHSFKIIGQTLDDAIGEAYDKVARILGLEYPGGPKIDKLAKEGKVIYDLPRPKTDGYNFSFSGLKNATLQLVNKLSESDYKKEDVAASFQSAALDVLMIKCLKAIKDFKPKHFILAGGVAANSALRALCSEQIKDIKLTLPPIQYTTDNALMIALAALHAIKEKDFASFDTPSKSYLTIDNACEK